MAAPRLPFLWPMLFRPLKPSRQRACIPSRTKPTDRQFATTLQRREEAPQRYGTAQEPAAHLRGQEPEKGEQTVEKPSSEPKKPSPEPIDEEEDEEGPPPATIPPSQTQSTSTPDAITPSVPAPDPPKTAESNPLDTVLHMPSPEEEYKKPPLKTPPYVHHFDTYSLVKDLTNSGFSQDQSVTVMKAVRSMLADNMQLAREGLVSKSNVENGTYLFRAACSELRVEIGNARKGEIDRMRTERNQLQHEVDITGQRLGQDTSHVKDELKGLFDDRKMAVRQEQRIKETKIQELNYKITIALNSDARSEVEGLRWVLTRRAAMALGITAFMVFVSLRYVSYVSHLDQEQRKREKNNPPSDQGRGPPPTAKPALSTDEPIGGELLTTEGGVSLG